MGKPIGCSNTRGYQTVFYEGSQWAVHRLAWIYHNGEIPEGLEIDHINRIKSDNRLENIRLVSRHENLHNATAKRGNKGGCVGVNWIKSKGIWRASICIKYSHTQLGSSKDYFEACCLRKSAEVKYYKEIGLI